VAGLNSEHGYGAVTKSLHWLTVAALAAQFTVGLTMDVDDAVLDMEKDRIEQFEEYVEGQGEAAEEMFEGEIDRMEAALDAQDDNPVWAAFGEPGLSLPEVHVLLGVSIVMLGVLRLLWRRVTPLPAWAPHLSAGERRLEAALEKALLSLLFVVPATGLVLLAFGDDWLGLHITAQVVLVAVIAVHVGLVLKHSVVRRNRHLSRML
jgi:cytochrome b561